MVGFVDCWAGDGLSETGECGDDSATSERARAKKMIGEKRPANARECTRMKSGKRLRFSRKKAKDRKN